LLAKFIGSILARLGLFIAEATWAADRAAG
jgi:hypothetical protein